MRPKVAAAFECRVFIDHGRIFLDVVVRYYRGLLIFFFFFMIFRENVPVICAPPRGRSEWKSIVS